MKTQDTVIKTKTELLKRIKGLGKISDEQKRAVVCSLIGHSRIQSAFFGRFNCGRCGAEVGDTLAGVYPGAMQAVVIGHKCETCEKNFSECTWKDKFMCPDPFKDESF